MVEVTAVNDALKSGVKTLSMVEDNIFDLSITDLSIDDPDSDPMQHYILMMPKFELYNEWKRPNTGKGFTGMLTVPITVSDAVMISPQTYRYEINDAPTITGQYPLAVEGDYELLIRIPDLLYDDVDDNNEQLVLKLPPGENYSVSGSSHSRSGRI